ncbi:MAG: hypothetical protein K9K82_10690, partial [Desulfobacteraceae bacterium]|nr:hypothetical protein [Desulfobacteraceae bacterium]
RGGRVYVGPDRVVPLCRLADKYPHVRESIMSLDLKEKNYWKPSDLEFWLLYKQVDPEEAGIRDTKHVQLINILNNGPACVSEILDKMGLHHVVQLKANVLFRQGVIEQATLTPTDLLHINGQMDAWDADCARQAVKCACGIFGRDRKTFVELTLDQIVAMMVEEAVVFLAGQSENSDLPDAVDGNWGRWLFDESIKGKNPHLAVSISSRAPVIGIGAPAGIFVKKVAEILKTPFVLPDHAHVANAAGAVAGSVVSEKEAILYTTESEGSHAYVVRIADETSSFKEYEDAIAHARRKAARLAREGAESAGASDPQVKVAVKTEGDLERIRARAVGNPRLAEQFGE